MKPLNANEKNSFDPTPELKSSPLPILFIPFINDDKNCIYCGDEYTVTPQLKQKYCKKCLLRYINEVKDINTYLDVTMKLECSQRELTPLNIHEILYFGQIYDYNWRCINKTIDTIDTCKLCGKLRRRKRSLFRVDKVNIDPCSECYRISSGRIESITTKKFISILHLPLWYSEGYCIACFSTLEFTSDCEKTCEKCYIIYSGCRYCLTTNAIFGFTDQSQCMKCKRVSFIDITKLRSGNGELDDFLYDMRSNLINKLSDHVANITYNDYISNMTRSIRNTYWKGGNRPNSLVKWIPYSKITNMKKIAEGGFGIIYQATWKVNNSNKTVIVKRLKNSHNIIKDFLNELKSNHSCYIENCNIIQIFGFTKDSELEDFMLVMEYASEGDLHNYLQRNFTKISWDKRQNLRKLNILWQISEGLLTIHRANYIHRDFHSGNILFNNFAKRKTKLSLGNQQYKIGDLGLSQSASNVSSNNEIYGVIPYIAPEIFNGAAFSKESDIYCFGMIMWELTTGCKPFANVEHDHILIYKIICGERPEITKDTPECFANLMKSCWHSDPKKRPSIREIHETFSIWCSKRRDSNRDQLDQFIQAEAKRKKLIESKELGPELTEKLHPKAIFTSRPLSSLISKASSINSSLSSGYNSKEYELGIDNRTSYNKGYVSKEFEFDIDDMDAQSSSSPDLNSAIQRFSTTQSPEVINTKPMNEFNLSTTPRKRNIEELSIEPHSNGKYIKYY